MSQATAYEEYMLQLVNRDRAENGDLPPLAFNLDLNDAAIGHTDWMIANGDFSHTGANGSDPGTRMTDAGYDFSGTWGWAENIAYVATSAAGLEADAAQLETDLMNSPPHRANLLNASYQEIGIGIDTGVYQGQESTFVTQDFAFRTQNAFLTGVAYEDTNGNKFYDVGEGLANVTVTAVNAATGQSFTTEANDAGGYQLELAAGTYKVTFSDGGVHVATTETETIGAQNVEADWVSPALASAGGGTPPSGGGSGGGTPFTASHDYNGTGQSQILIENSNGAVDIGEVGANDQLGYLQVSAIGSEWTIGGSGDFLGQGHAQYLLENANGAIDIGSVSNGHAAYTQVGWVGHEWTLSGTGTYLGAGTSDFLLENTSGAVDVGSVVNGQATYTEVAAISSAWKIVGSGDFLGLGHDQFLIQNTNGAIDVGNVVNGLAHFTQVSAIGSAWTIEGAGDFLGDGKSQFLLHNTNGAVDIGEVGANGQVTYTQVAAIGSEWKFVGTGDLLRQGHDQFVLENTNGAVDVGNVVNGHAVFTQVGALGHEWTFHM